MSKEISIVIPTYNERANITPLVQRIGNALSHRNYEVIFIDDNSPDGTADEVNSLAASYPVKVVVRQQKRGLASAVIDGFRHASADIIAVMDADLQHPPDIIPELMTAIESGADLAIASRYIPGSSLPDWSPVRKLISKGAIFIAHLLLPATRSVKDPMSGCFMLRRDVVSAVALNPSGFKILLEVLLLGKYRQVAQCPITFSSRDQGKSKLSARQQLDYLWHVYSLMRRTGELARFIKFCLVGLSGVGVNLGLLWLLTERAGLFYVLSAAISIEASIVSNFLLNNFLTFSDRRRQGIRALLNHLLRFNIVSLIGVGINLGILWLFTSVFGVYYLASQCVGIIFATLWNYLVNNWWTWEW